MFTLRKQFRFEAAHHLPQHDGKCQRVHGHSWVGYLIVEGTSLAETGPKSGMLVDYGDMRAAIKHVIEDYLDHWDLNETTGLFNPTSEELAKWVYNKVKEQLPLLTAVVIEETCTASCEYRP